MFTFGKRFVHLPDTKNGDTRGVPLLPVALELFRELSQILEVIR